ncbi:hypothetical protein, partial [Nonomuraea rubra]|uniref:hypothetical protein n=1 Tax=Nonomuraea rubra TaxID=46180 RepID=UPI0031E8F275
CSELEVRGRLGAWRSRRCCNESACAVLRVETGGRPPEVRSAWRRGGSDLPSSGARWSSVFGVVWRNRGDSTV